jgi:hypothetical protein
MRRRPSSHSSRRAGGARAGGLHIDWGMPAPKEVRPHPTHSPREREDYRLCFPRCVCALKILPGAASFVAREHSQRPGFEERLRVPNCFRLRKPHANRKRVAGEEFGGCEPPTAFQLQDLEE